MKVDDEVMKMLFPVELYFSSALRQLFSVNSVLLADLNLLIEKFVHGILIGHLFRFVRLFVSRWYSVAIGFNAARSAALNVLCVRTRIGCNTSAICGM